jgi:hypothetical protein
MAGGGSAAGGRRSRRWLLHALALLAVRCAAPVGSLPTSPAPAARPAPPASAVAGAPSAAAGSTPPRATPTVVLNRFSSGATPAASVAASPRVPVDAVQVTVDAGSVLGAISPLAFGSNTGPWQNLTRAMRAALPQAHLGLLRFPGGNWGDEHVLGLGQLQDFVGLCRTLGAEPLVNVKLPGSSPVQAAGWVRQANLAQHLGITYWGIGNEPSLYQSKRHLDAWDAAYHADQWRAFASAMKATDPTIRLIGPEPHQFTGRPGADPVDAAGHDWLRTFVQANGDLVDVVAIHRYPFGPELPTPAALLANAAEWDTLIPALRAAVRQAAGRDLPVAVTEVNADYTNVAGRPTSPDSLLGGLWWADVQGRLLAQQVEMVAHFALADAGGLGLLDSLGERPVFGVFTLYAELRGQLIRATASDPAVRAYAALRPDGRLAVLLLNTAADDRMATVEARWPGPRPVEQLTRIRWQLDAAHPTPQPGAPEAVLNRFSTPLAGYSASLLRLE